MRAADRGRPRLGAGSVAVPFTALVVLVVVAAAVVVAPLFLVRLAGELLLLLRFTFLMTMTDRHEDAAGETECQCGCGDELEHGACLVATAASRTAMRGNCLDSASARVALRAAALAFAVRSTRWAGRGLLALLRRAWGLCRRRAGPLFARLLVARTGLARA